MLAMSPLLCPTLEWEYPIEIVGIIDDHHQGFDNFDFDSVFLNNNISSSSSQAQGSQEQESNDLLVKERSESPQGTSSTDHHHQCDGNKNPVSAKKLNHNASERDRRKKINEMYSSLRSLLPGIDHKKKLSIPTTVGRVLEYIPELQKEVKTLTRKKDVLLSKISAFEGNVEELIKEENPKNRVIKETTMSCSISINRLGDKEMVIQISSAFEKIIISEILLLLEKNGFLVIDVSSFQSFGGAIFYNLHVWMEGNYIINLEMLNEALMSLLHTQKHIDQLYS